MSSLSKDLPTVVDQTPTRLSISPPFRPAAIPRVASALCISFLLPAEKKRRGHTHIFFAEAIESLETTSLELILGQVDLISVPHFAKILVVWLYWEVGSGWE